MSPTTITPSRSWPTLTRPAQLSTAYSRGLAFYRRREERRISVRNAVNVTMRQQNNAALPIKRGKKVQNKNPAEQKSRGNRETHANFNKRLNLTLLSALVPITRNSR